MGEGAIRDWGVYTASKKKPCPYTVFSGASVHIQLFFVPPTKRGLKKKKTPEGNTQLREIRPRPRGGKGGVPSWK